MPGLRAPGDRVELTLESVTQTTALYSLYTALGDPLSGTIYATDSSNNTVTATIVTDPGTGLMTAEFTSLNPATTYSIPPQAVTGSGSGIQSTYTFTTLDVPQKLYGSVNGSRKRIRKLYFGYGVTQEIRLASYISDFDTDTFLAKMENYLPGELTADNLKKYPNIVVKTDSSSQLSIFFYNDAGAKLKRTGYNYPLEIIFGSRSNFTVYIGPCATWVAGDGGWSAWDYFTGLAVGTETPFVKAGFPYVAKRIAKLYGSVNGSAKLIYEDPNA